jgi:CubicO group peptidase (beta-lactamase class C family)
MTMDTVFRVGFFGQALTGTAILKLEEDGLLSVDDHICDYLKTCPEAWSEITIYQVATHSSGIPDYYESDTDYQDITISDITHVKLLEKIYDDVIYTVQGDIVRHRHQA